jgi:hypothetical protein
MVAFDYGIKAQLGFTNFIDLLIWTSFGEIGLFAIVFLCFLRSPAGMGYVFFHLTHVGRGICGLIIIHRAPKISDLIDRLNPTANMGEDTTIQDEESAKK